MVTPSPLAEMHFFMIMASFTTLPPVFATSSATCSAMGLSFFRHIVQTEGPASDCLDPLLPT